MSVPHHPDGWIEEARRRLQSAHIVRKDGSLCSATSLLYFGLWAAGKAALIPHGEHPKTHGALPNRLGIHYVKSGRLPKRTSTLFYEVHTLRINADYYGDELSDAEWEAVSSDVAWLIDEIGATL